LKGYQNGKKDKVFQLGILNSVPHSSKPHGLPLDLIQGPTCVIRDFNFVKRRIACFSHLISNKQQNLKSFKISFYRNQLWPKILPPHGHLTFLSPSIILYGLKSNASWIAKVFTCGLHAYSLWKEFKHILLYTNFTVFNDGRW